MMTAQQPSAGGGKGYEVEEEEEVDSARMMELAYYQIACGWRVRLHGGAGDEEEGEDLGNVGDVGDEGVGDGVEEDGDTQALTHPHIEPETETDINAPPVAEAIPPPTKESVNPPTSTPPCTPPRITPQSQSPQTPPRMLEMAAALAARLGGAHNVLKAIQRQRGGGMEADHGSGNGSDGNGAEIAGREADGDGTGVENNDTDGGMVEQTAKDVMEMDAVLPAQETSHSVDPPNPTRPSQLPPSSARTPSPPETDKDEASENSRSSTSPKTRASSPHRPHICRECKKGFTKSGHVARHMRIHTGVKPYPCLLPDCPARFSRKDHMMQHYRAHRTSPMDTDDLLRASYTPGQETATMQIPDSDELLTGEHMQEYERREEVGQPGSVDETRWAHVQGCGRRVGHPEDVEPLTEANTPNAMENDPQPGSGTPHPAEPRTGEQIPANTMRSDRPRTSSDTGTGTVVLGSEVVHSVDAGLDLGPSARETATRQPDSGSSDESQPAMETDPVGGSHTPLHTGAHIHPQTVAQDNTVGGLTAAIPSSSSTPTNIPSTPTPPPTDSLAEPGGESSQPPADALRERGAADGQRTREAEQGGSEISPPPPLSSATTTLPVTMTPSHGSLIPTSHTPLPKAVALTIVAAAATAAAAAAVVVARYAAVREDAAVDPAGDGDSSGDVTRDEPGMSPLWGQASLTTTSTGDASQLETQATPASSPAPADSRAGNGDEQQEGNGPLAPHMGRPPEPGSQGWVGRPPEVGVGMRLDGVGCGGGVGLGGSGMVTTGMDVIAAASPVPGTTEAQSRDTAPNGSQIRTAAEAQIRPALTPAAVAAATTSRTQDEAKTPAAAIAGQHVSTPAAAPTPTDPNHTQAETPAAAVAGPTPASSRAAPTIANPTQVHAKTPATAHVVRTHTPSIPAAAPTPTNLNQTQVKPSAASVAVTTHTPASAQAALPATSHTKVRTPATSIPVRPRAQPPTSSPASILIDSDDELLTHPAPPPTPYSVHRGPSGGVVIEILDDGQPASSTPAPRRASSFSSSGPSIKRPTSSASPTPTPADPSPVPKTGETKKRKRPLPTQSRVAKRPVPGTLYIDLVCDEADEDGVRRPPGVRPGRASPVRWRVKQGGNAGKTGEPARSELRRKHGDGEEEGGGRVEKKVKRDPEEGEDEMGGDAGMSVSGKGKQPVYGPHTTLHHPRQDAADHRSGANTASYRAKDDTKTREVVYFEKGGRHAEGNAVAAPKFRSQEHSPDPLTELAGEKAASETLSKEIGKMRDKLGWARGSSGTGVYDSGPKGHVPASASSSSPTTQPKRGTRTATQRKDDNDPSTHHDDEPAVDTSRRRSTRRSLRSQTLPTSPGAQSPTLQNQHPTAATTPCASTAPEDTDVKHLLQTFTPLPIGFFTPALYAAYEFEHKIMWWKWDTLYKRAKRVARIPQEVGRAYHREARRAYHHTHLGPPDTAHALLLDRKRGAGLSPGAVEEIWAQNGVVYEVRGVKRGPRGPKLGLTALLEGRRVGQGRCGVGLRRMMEARVARRYRQVASHQLGAGHCAELRFAEVVSVEPSPEGDGDAETREDDNDNPENAPPPQPRTKLLLTSAHFTDQSPNYNKPGGVVSWDVSASGWGDNLPDIARVVGETPSPESSDTSPRSHTWLHPPSGHRLNDNINDLVYSPAGDVLFTGSAHDSVIKAWWADDGDLLYEVSPPEHNRRSEGVELVTRNRGRRWGRRAARFVDLGVQRLAVRPAGAGPCVVAAAGYDGGVRQFAFGSVGQFGGGEDDDVDVDALRCVDMSPALEEEEIADPEVFRVGTTVMYGHGGSADLLFAGFERPRNQVGCGLIRLYDGEKQVGRLEVGENAVACMGVSASGAYLVAGVTGNAPMVHEKESDFSGEGDGKLRVFDVRGGGRRTGRIPVEVFDTAQRDHNVVGFSPCEHYVYACCDPDATKRQPHTAVFDRRFARSPLLSVRDTSTTTTTTTPSRFLSTSVPQPPQPAPIRLEHAACNRGDANDGVTCAVWMRSGLFYTGGQDEVVRVWDVRRAREDMLVSVMGGMEGPISCMCVSPDEDYIAVGTTTGKVHLWTALDPIACINEWDRNAGAKTGGGGGRDWGGVTVLR